jgi:hypothetical protein
VRPLVCFCVGIVLLATAHAQTTFSCPSGKEDMLSYFMMGYPNRVDKFMGPGNANPIYSVINPEIGSAYATQGTFLWIKSVNGFPWDIKSFDGKYVYDRTTELSWTDPQKFKRFIVDLPMSARCVPVGYPGPAIRIPPSASAYKFYSACTAYQTGQLNYVYNTVSAPVKVTTGNLGTVTTRRFKYRYACDSNYSNCQYMEVFSLGRNVGLYDWKYYVNQNGSWVLKQDSLINQLSSGATTPNLPCTTSYQ